MSEAFVLWVNVLNSFEAYASKVYKKAHNSLDIFHTQQFNYIVYTRRLHLAWFMWAPSTTWCTNLFLFIQILAISLSLTLFSCSFDAKMNTIQQNTMWFNRYVYVVWIRIVAFVRQYVKIPADSELFDWILTNTLFLFRFLFFLLAFVCATIKHVLVCVCV